MKTTPSFKLKNPAVAEITKDLFTPYVEIQPTEDLSWDDVDEFRKTLAEYLGTFVKEVNHANEVLQTTKVVNKEILLTIKMASEDINIFVEEYESIWDDHRECSGPFKSPNEYQAAHAIFNRYLKLKGRITPLVSQHLINITDYLATVASLTASKNEVEENND